MNEYDVVIVGAGPAGSTLAYRLAQQGLQVALLEAKRMPRVKPCGGGIDGLFMKYLPVGIDLDGVIEGEATKFNLDLDPEISRKGALQGAGSQEKNPLHR